MNDIQHERLVRLGKTVVVVAPPLVAIVYLVFLAQSLLWGFWGVPPQFNAPLPACKHEATPVDPSACLAALRPLFIWLFSLVGALLMFVHLALKPLLFTEWLLLGRPAWFTEHMRWMSDKMEESDKKDEERRRRKGGGLMGRLFRRWDEETEHGGS